MLSVSNLITQEEMNSLLESSKFSSSSKIESSNGKKFQVTTTKIRVNGKDVNLKFRRDLETNKLYPQTKGKKRK